MQPRRPLSRNKDRQAPNASLSAASVSPPYSSRRQTTAEEAQPVAVEDGVDVGVAVLAGREDLAELLQVGDALQVAGGLFPAEAPVEVGADGAVATVAGELADAVDVVRRGGDVHHLGAGLAADPVGVEHPRVERHADDGVARDERLDLL